uniref:Uncharacterized protein n=1 Tax=Zosterops lateralis melanops TaxID=1220523 RepID=A0A8D2PFZ5_ZOSLA
MCYYCELTLCCFFFSHIVFPTQNGKVAIVTGGAKGIGYQTVKHLARLGMHVIIAGNSESDGQEAVRKIKEETLTGKAV